jgi:hypothetical protein
LKNARCWESFGCSFYFRESDGSRNWRKGVVFVFYYVVHYLVARVHAIRKEDRVAIAKLVH